MTLKEYKATEETTPVDKFFIQIFKIRLYRKINSGANKIKYISISQIVEQEIIVCWFQDKVGSRLSHEMKIFKGFQEIISS